MHHVAIIHPIHFGHSPFVQFAIAIFITQRTEKQKKLDKPRPRLGTCLTTYRYARRDCDYLVRGLAYISRICTKYNCKKTISTWRSLLSVGNTQQSGRPWMWRIGAYTCALTLSVGDTLGHPIAVVLTTVCWQSPWFLQYLIIMWCTVQSLFEPSRTWLLSRCHARGAARLFGRFYTLPGGDFDPRRATGVWGRGRAS